MKEFKDYLNDARLKIDHCLEEVLSAIPKNELLPPILHAVEGGKRVRGFMVLEGAKIHGLEDKSSHYAAVAIELLHAYSLVHDDLPCMDNDPLRRGKPTIHVKWDEMTAVLTGDALLTLAFQVLANQNYILDPSIKTQLIYDLTVCSGLQGMVHGQFLDMVWDNSKTSANTDDVATIQSLKTGAIIGWSCKAGAILAGADPQPLERYAENLGIAYQISDDLLDVRGETDVTGKNVGKDAGLGKPTYVSKLGEIEAQRQAEQYVANAISSLNSYGQKAEYLRELARYSINRNK